MYSKSIFSCLLNFTFYYSAFCKTPVSFETFWDQPLLGAKYRLDRQLLQIVVGPSVDPAGVTMVDSVKVYTKLKESFNWPDDSDDSPDSTMTKAPASGSNVSTSETATEGSTNATVATPAPLTSMDRCVRIYVLVN